MTLKHRVSDTLLDDLDRTMPTDKPDNVFIQGSKLLIADLKDARAEIKRLERLLEEERESFVDELRVSSERQDN